MAKKIGIDTSILIYLFEKNPRYLDPSKKIFTNIKNKKNEGVLSCIGVLEILTGPKKIGRHDIAAIYKEHLINFPNLEIKPINENIIDIASDLRAKYKISTPDAIHIATAIDSNAQKFITNDKKLEKIEEIKVQLLK